MCDNRAKEYDAFLCRLAALRETYPCTLRPCSWLSRANKSTYTVGSLNFFDEERVRRMHRGSTCVLRTQPQGGGVCRPISFLSFFFLVLCFPLSFFSISRSFPFLLLFLRGIFLPFRSGIDQVVWSGSLFSQPRGRRRNVECSLSNVTACGIDPFKWTKAPAVMIPLPASCATTTALSLSLCACVMCLFGMRFIVIPCSCHRRPG